MCVISCNFALADQEGRLREKWILCVGWCTLFVVCLTLSCNHSDFNFRLNFWRKLICKSHATDIRNFLSSLTEQTAMPHKRHIRIISHRLVKKPCYMNQIDTHIIWAITEKQDNCEGKYSLPTTNFPRKRGDFLAQQNLPWTYDQTTLQHKIESAHSDRRPCHTN